MHGCEYCYARSIAKRFGEHKVPPGPIVVLSERQKGEIAASWNGDQKVKGFSPYPFDFMPTLHMYRMDEPERKVKPQTVFVCSMADLFGEWVPDWWIREVCRACEASPQHRFIFLTKNPARYLDLQFTLPLPASPRYWYGTSATSMQDFGWRGNVTLLSGLRGMHRFLSIEPILGPLDERGLNALGYFHWIIVGAESGQRKGKVVPERSWIEGIAASCVRHGVPLLMKESLRGLMGQEFIQQFPWEVPT
jgi:protein gp37